MHFIDCNTFIGTPTRQEVWSAVSADELLAALDKADIRRAVVWHIAQHDLHPGVGNDMLMQQIAGRTDRLIPCFAIPSPHTDEMGDIDTWFTGALQAGVRVMRICRTRGAYLMRPEVVGGIIERLLRHRIPLIYSISRGGDWNEIYELLKAFPDLRVILSDLDVWPSDRLFRPLLDLYPNVVIETSGYFVPGGIEALVQKYGSGRLLFGSGYPACYHGGLMLTILHADIDDAAKQAIACGNMQRLLNEVVP